MIVAWQNQDIAVALPDEFGRQHKEVRANGIQRGVEVFLGQTEPLEPMHQVVGKQQDLKERYIGDPIVGGDFPQRVIVEQFADILLDRGVLMAVTVFPGRREPCQNSCK